MDIQRIRQDFPLLNENRHTKPLVYFDNACQSLRPMAVIEAINRYYLEFPACGGRSMHRLAEKVTQEIDHARMAIAKLVNASRKEEIVFTRNTTEGINLVAHSLGLKKDDEVILSDKEHNSNLIPWQLLCKRVGITLKIIQSHPDNSFNLDGYRDSFNKSTKLVAIGMTSNLDGMTVPAYEVIRYAHNNGCLVLLDAAQTVPHQKLDVCSLDVDFAAFSGHKMLGPSGTGVLYGKIKLLEQLAPFLVGGETVISTTYSKPEFLPPPEKFEAGLQDYAGIIGLRTAAEYLQKTGYSLVEKQGRAINKFITEEISSIPRLKIIGPADASLRGGIISFYLDGVDSHQVAIMLDQMDGILVRSGQHCVHSWFNSHKVEGSVRASFYFYNTMEEAERFVVSLRKISKVI